MRGVAAIAGFIILVFSLGMLIWSFVAPCCKHDRVFDEYKVYREKWEELKQKYYVKPEYDRRGIVEAYYVFNCSHEDYVQVLQDRECRLVAVYRVVSFDLVLDVYYVDNCVNGTEVCSILYNLSRTSQEIRNTLIEEDRESTQYRIIAVLGMIAGGILFEYGRRTG